MNKKKLILIPAFALMAFFIGGCSAKPNNWAGLSADGERAYLATGSEVYAVDLGTGKEVWHYPEKADGKRLYFANPVVTPDGQLLIGSEGTAHVLLSLDPKTGKENWAEPFSAANGLWVASPLVLNDRIYAPNTDGNIYVLDMDGKSAADPIGVGGALWSTPATDGTHIYVASLDHRLHVIDPVSATTSAAIDLGGAAPSSPLAATDGAYVGSFASKIVFVSTAGESSDVAKASNWIWGTPVLDSETLYYADLDGNVYAFDLAARKQNWAGIKVDAPVVASLLLDKDQLYVATEKGTLVALDRDGKQVWEKTVAGSIYTSPVAGGDLILVAPYGADFMLAAYDASNKQAWTFTPQK